MANVDYAKKSEWIKKFDYATSGSWNHTDFFVLTKCWETLGYGSKNWIKNWMADNFLIELDLYGHKTLSQIWEQCEGNQKAITMLWRKVFGSIDDETKTWMLNRIKQQTSNSQQIGA